MTDPAPRTLSVVIALHNEEATLPLLYERLESALASRPERREYLFVDDGSTDATFDRLAALAQSDPKVTGLKLSRNFGHHVALFAGIDQAAGEVCVLMDGDLQDRPEDIPRMIEKLDEGYDVVYALREMRTDPPLRRLSSDLFWWLIRFLTGLAIPPHQAVLRVFSGRARRALAHLDERQRFLAGLFAWIGFKQTSVTVTHAPREAGRSSYTLRRLVGQALNAVLSFSSRPLRLISYAGVAVSLMAVAIGVGLTGIRLFASPHIPGWTSLIVVILLMSGAQLFCLGIVAEYLAKVYQQTLHRPPYIVERVAGGKGGDAPKG